MKKIKKFEEANPLPASRKLGIVITGDSGLLSDLFDHTGQREATDEEKAEIEAILGDRVEKTPSPFAKGTRHVKVGHRWLLSPVADETVSPQP